MEGNESLHGNSKKIVNNYRYDLRIDVIITEHAIFKFILNMKLCGQTRRTGFKIVIGFDLFSIRFFDVVTLVSIFQVS